jgi:hypothetical protein
MILADAWSAVGGIAAVVAALAALITIWYARATVGEARAARQEASDAHAEEMAEQRRALQASTTAHQEQMREREQALAAEVKLQRVVQLERVAEVLTDLAGTAQAEATHPPGRPVTDQAGRRLTGIPAVLARLRAAVALLDALGGPELPTARQLGNQVGGTPAERTLSSAIDALREIESLARSGDDRLKLKRPTEAPFVDDCG